MSAEMGMPWDPTQLAPFRSQWGFSYSLIGRPGREFQYSRVSLIVGDFILPFYVRSQGLRHIAVNSGDFYLHVNHRFSSWMSLTWNFHLILFFVFCLLVFFHQALWLTRKKKKIEEGVIWLEQGLSWQLQRRVLWMWKEKTQCFILL